jgi:hypothetical protein
MFDKLFPRVFDNSYRGYKTALWLLGIVAALKLVQSGAIIFNGYSTVIGADGIPLDTYPAAASQTIVGLFGLISLWRLLFCLLSILVLVQYRSAAPLMLLLFALQFLGAELLGQFIPIVRIGTPPGIIVNLILFVLMLIGLALSLLNKRVHP